jgi:hypothetical protein
VTRSARANGSAAAAGAAATRRQQAAATANTNEPRCRAQRGAPAVAIAEAITQTVLMAGITALGAAGGLFGRPASPLAGQARGARQRLGGSVHRAAKRAELAFGAAVAPLARRNAPAPTVAKPKPALATSSPPPVASSPPIDVSVTESVTECIAAPPAPAAATAPSVGCDSGLAFATDPNTPLLSRSPSSSLSRAAAPPANTVIGIASPPPAASPLRPSYAAVAAGLAKSPAYGSISNSGCVSPLGSRPPSRSVSGLRTSSSSSSSAAAAASSGTTPLLSTCSSSLLHHSSTIDAAVPAPVSPNSALPSVTSSTFVRTPSSPISHATAPFATAPAVGATPTLGPTVERNTPATTHSALLGDALMVAGSAALFGGRLAGAATVCAGAAAFEGARWVAGRPAHEGGVTRLVMDEATWANYSAWRRALDAVPVWCT